MDTVYEREFVAKPLDLSAHHLSGFSSRPINRLVTTRQPQTVLNIETNHIKREFRKKPSDIVPLLEYQLWLEAGKLDKANFKAPDGDSSIVFNSNIWRNFRNSAGLATSKKGTVSEAISSLYPVYIPVPSQVGANTLARYYEQNKRNIFKSDKTYQTAMSKVEKEASMMKYLRLKSEMRNPPLDWNGNILPPKNFKKYPPFSKSDTLASAFTSDDGIHYPHLQSSSSNGGLVPVGLNVTGANSNRKQFLPTKLVFRDNHPHFQKVLLEQQIKSVYRSTTNSVKTRATTTTNPNPNTNPNPMNSNQA